LPGVFENLTKGIKQIKLENDDIIIRVNTVVSPYNVKDLTNILDLITVLGVDQWSIIPLKSSKNLWLDVNRDELLNNYLAFRKKIRKIESPKLLGYSKEWAGKNIKDINRYFDTGISKTPKNKCSLAGLVNFYVPFSKRLTPCNCVPWRLKNVNFETQFGLSALSDGSMEPFIDYLYRNASKICQGCEPINSYLGDHPEIIEKDIFSF
jgi:MoaA/NifB/PqqE/SkfB family radical SAM enzyme